MEQEAGEGIGGGEIGGDRNQQPQRQPQPPPPPQQPQQCPRCESLNTKFCYYNNYSLSQPRFFCKACKRYWTHGGTLRNIPIGGASRKAKRSKGSSSSSTMSSSSGLQPQPQPQSEPQSQQPRPQQVTQEVVQIQLQNQPNLTTSMRPTPPRVVQPTSPYYQGGGIGGGGGYLSSLAAVHSMNPPQQPLNQSLNVVASSNSGLLSGFNNAVSASLGSQPHHLGQIRPPRFYPIGNNRVVESLLRPEHGFNVPSNMANNTAASRPDHWPHSFTNNANHSAPDTTLWSTVSTTSSISGNTQHNTRGGRSSSLIPNYWPNLPGNGSPYQ